MFLRTKFLLFTVIFLIHFSAKTQQLDSLSALFGPVPEFTYNFCLKSVSFGGVPHINYINIIQDGTQNDFYLAPHFELQSSTCNFKTLGNKFISKPVAYVSGTNIMVKAEFLTDCPNPIYVKAIAESKYLFRSIQLMPSNGKITYEDNGAFVPCNMVLDVGIVKYYPSFKIKWYFSYDNNKFSEIGTSDNELFVTHDVPIENAYHHTIFYTSCKAAADNNSEVLIKESITNKINTKAVERRDGNIMTYWNSLASSCYTAWQLIKFYDGRCEAWADFHKGCFEVQSFQTELVEVTAPQEDFTKIIPNVKSKGQNTLVGVTVYDHAPIEFSVKNWSSGFSVQLGQFDMRELESKKDFDIGGAGGIKGQGTLSKEIRSIFDNHAIIKNSSQYYDPSYGFGPFKDEAKYEDSGIHAIQAVFYYDTRDDNTGMLLNPPMWYVFFNTLNNDDKQLNYK